MQFLNRNTGKKGQGTEIADVLSLFFLVMIMIVFMIFFYKPDFFGDKEKITEGLTIVNTKGYLVNYLSANINFGNKIISMADLMNFWYYDNKNENYLRNKTRDVLTYFPKPNVDSNWHVGTYKNGKALFRSYYDPIHTTYNQNWGHLLVYLDLYNKDRLVIEFFNEEGKSFISEAALQEMI